GLTGAVIALELGQWRDQAARLPRRPQAHVYLIKTAVGAQEAGSLDDALREVSEILEVLCGFEAVKAAGTWRRHGPAVALVDHDQVQVAVVAHLPAAEFPQAQDHEARRLASAGPGRQAGHAKALPDWLKLKLSDLRQDHLGQVAQSRGGLRQRILAED